MSKSPENIDGIGYARILEWLERALIGKAALPLIVPDETPEGPIQRLDRELSEITRKDLRDACRALVRRFAANPNGEDAYISALLRLATGFQLTDVGNALHQLIGRSDEFEKLGEPKQKAVISALLDLRLPLGLAFWRDLAARVPESLGVLTFSGLLNQGRHAAFDVLQDLPNDEVLADALYVALDQHATNLSSKELPKLVEVAKAIVERCQPQIQTAVQEWVDAQDDLIVPGEHLAHTRDKLESALAVWFSRMNKSYTRNPTSARLANV